MRRVFSTAAALVALTCATPAMGQVSWLVRAGRNAASAEQGAQLLGEAVGVAGIRSGTQGGEALRMLLERQPEVLQSSAVQELVLAAERGELNFSNELISGDVERLLRNAEFRAGLLPREGKIADGLPCGSEGVEQLAEVTTAIDEAAAQAALSGGGRSVGGVLTGEQYTRLTSDDVYLFNEGTLAEAYDKLGSHLMTVDGVEGTYFAVWAPNADSIGVMGSFNGWNKGSHQLVRRGDSGIWEGFIPGVRRGDQYKYHIRNGDFVGEKADPYAFLQETPPGTASVVEDTGFEWADDAWLANRANRTPEDPMSIYEVHWGSWRRGADGEMLSVEDQAQRLAEYAEEMGFTHVELMPVSHHPYEPSWGYQTLGQFAPTSQWFSSPQEFQMVVNELHKRNIGVIVDWVPAHFPTASSNPEGLGMFDGTHLYEHADPRQGFHPDWNTSIPNFGRNEVRSYYASSANFWIDGMHVDGLRTDGVASMLYNSYGREGQMGEAWVPSIYNGRPYQENLEAIRMLRQVNNSVHARHPGVVTIAEESTAFPRVTGEPAAEGGETFDVSGLRFDGKWNMGSMHDSLEFLSKDPVYRKWAQDEFTNRYMWQHAEDYVHAYSHDEVVYGKGSLLEKMPGDDWQKFANLRVLYGLEWGEPGKKLLFMGQEFAQREEWKYAQSLDWHLLGEGRHQGVQQLVRDLNQLYKTEPALRVDHDPSGFRFITSDKENSVVAFMRQGRNPDEQVLVVANFTPVPRSGYRVGVPTAGRWNEIMNTDATVYGGSGMGNMGGVSTSPEAMHGFDQSVELTLPPLSVTYFRVAP